MFNYRKVLDALDVYVPGKPIEDVRRELGLDRVVKLASNESPYGCSPTVRQAVADSLSSAFVYPDGNCTKLRGAVAAKHGVPPGSLVFGAGLDEVIYMLGKAFIEPGDESVTAEVTFSQYEASVVSMGGKMLFAPMDADYGHDLDEYAKLVTDKTRLVFIANPNNPTGRSHTQEQQAAFMRKVPEDCLVVFDEAYSEYVDAGADYPRTLEMMGDYPNMIYMKTFSKIYGLASFRIGYAVADPRVVALLEKVRGPFNVSSQAQAAALAALGDEEFIAEAVRNNALVKEYTVGRLEAMGLGYIPSQANFMMIDVRRNSYGFFNEMMRLGYIVRAGAAFGMDDYIRVTLGTMGEMEGFFEALGRLV
jgi:histidinol-phosphate aminotransferase